MNGGRVCQDRNDPNRVTVIIEGELSGIEKYGESEQHKETMAQAGVLGPPTVLFAEDVT